MSDEQIAQSSKVFDEGLRIQEMGWTLSKDQEGRVAMAIVILEEAGLVKKVASRTVPGAVKGRWYYQRCLA